MRGWIHNKRTIIGTLVICGILLLGVIGCSSEEKKIVLASKPMPEQFIIAEMLTMLIEDNTDIKVEQKLGITGGISNIQPGMENGEIDLYPEYTGTGWLFQLKKDVIRDSEELYQAVKAAYKEEYGIIWSGLYGFNNTYGIAVTQEVAEQYDLKTYSDLAKVSDQLVFSANYDFFEREDGYKGLENTYGFAFKNNKEIDIGLKYQAIENKEVDATTIYSTDGQLENAGLVVLEDDLQFFPAYHCATLIREETLEKYPELEKELEKLTGLISTEEMIKMNYLVEIENEDPKIVAENFLIEKGLRQ